jgi:hypothetical protein
VPQAAGTGAAAALAAILDVEQEPRCIPRHDLRLRRDSAVLPIGAEVWPGEISLKGGACAIEQRRAPGRAQGRCVSRLAHAPAR